MRIRPIPGLGAAATLAAVTLAVFATFQNYGPESAVRRFHQALTARDLKAIAQVVDTSPDNSAVQDLARYVEAARMGNPNYRIVKSERGKDQVEILAFYASGALIPWVVVRDRDHWRIDSYLTLQGLQKMGKS